VTVSLRRATVVDVPFLVSVVTHADVRPFLAVVRPSSPAEIEAAIAEEHDPTTRGLFVVEVGGEPVGTVSFETVNRRSRIASLHSLAVLPEGRAGGTAHGAVAVLLGYLFDELEFHRVECEVYGFNGRGAAFFDAAGFVREGVRRSAYHREGEWVDGIRFGLLADEPRRAARSGNDDNAADE
jgi:RimJ/RimL family protein N-acetyltransferase